VAVAQLVESRIVIPVVAGSSPVSHPIHHFQQPGLPGFLLGGAAILRAGTSGLVRAACVGWRTLRAGAPIAFKFHARDHQYITVFHCEQLSEQLTPTAMIFCFHDFRIRLLYTFPAGQSSP
jgi:hypothetical protein